MKIGIFGGSFNPPHLGHLSASRFFAEALALDKMYIVPAGDAPLKSICAQVCAEDRLALCELTFPFPVTDIEIARGGVSYTIDTLREICARNPEAQVFLLIGTDQLRQFTLWREWREILKLCTVCALRRDGETLQTDLPVKLLDGFVPIDISSTKLRGMLAQGEDVSRWITPETYRHIVSKGLYLEPALPPERLYHSRRVADAAETLARKYGADPKKARFAGLWHDCGKYLPHAEPVTAQSHGIAGASFLARHLGITDEEVLTAVRWHTTGHTGMALLAEIIFMADLVSADRDYPDVEIVRALANEDLRAASKYILEYIIAKLGRQGRRVHPDALAWYGEM